MSKMTVKNEPVFKHMSWCHKNNIIIIFQPNSNNSNGNIIIIEDGEEFVSEELYRCDNKLYRRKKVKGEPPQRTYSERIFELYTIKYNEHNEEK